MNGRARRGVALVAIGALTLLAVAGCGVPHQDHPVMLNKNGVNVIGIASSTSFAPGTLTRRAELCFILGDHLVKVLTQLRLPLTARSAVAALVDVSQSTVPPGTRSLIDAPALVAVGRTTRGVATVELNASFSQIPPADQILALGQVVCTLTSLPGTGQVQFTHGGKPIDVPRADGSLTDQPVSRFDYKQLLPAP